MSACDVAPLSKRVDTFCLSSGKAKNILIILLILSNKLPLRLCNGGRWQLVNLKPEYDEYYIKTRSFFLDLPDHPAMEEQVGADIAHCRCHLFALARIAGSAKSTEKAWGR